MGGEGGQEQQQGAHVALGAAVLLEIAHQRHHGGDGGVELHGLDVVGHLLDALVNARLVLLGVLKAVGAALRQIPHLVEEALAALDGVGLPRGSLLEVAHEHDIDPQGVRAELLDHAVGVDHVAQ